MGREWWWILGAYSPELSTAALYVWSGVTCGVIILSVVWNQSELGTPNQMSLTALVCFSSLCRHLTGTLAYSSHFRTGGQSEINYRDFSLEEQPYVELRELARVRAPPC